MAVKLVHAHTDTIQDAYDHRLRITVPSDPFTAGTHEEMHFQHFPTSGLRMEGNGMSSIIRAICSRKELATKK